MEASKAILVNCHSKPNGVGDMDGSGLQRILGTPTQDNLTVLIREMAQNSWDAREMNRTVQFSLATRNIDDRQWAFLREAIFADRDLSTGHEELIESLDRRRIPVMEIHDRGTKGLGGPVRTDIVSDSESQDFINLIFNVGTTVDFSTGGGTYGFGKVAPFRLSRCRTVLFWSRTQYKGQVEDRFIAVTLGSKFEHVGKRYTGHHWWGKLISDGRIEPIRGEKATEIGETLFSRTFSENELGTSIMILDFEDSDSSEDLEGRLVEIIQQNLWPKRVYDQTHKRLPMAISLSVDGDPVELPDPKQTPEYTGLSRCLEAVRLIQTDPTAEIEPGVRVLEVSRMRPAKLLGHIGLVYLPRIEDVGGAENYVASKLCLMRHDAELVVKYEKHRPAPSAELSWFGVFKPVMDTDRAFAVSEPPAHDDWHPQSVTDSDLKSIVRVAATRRQELVRDFLQPGGAFTDLFQSEKVPSGILSEELGWITGASSDADGGPDRVGARSSRGASGRRVNRAPEVSLEVTDRGRTEDKDQQWIQAEVSWQEPVSDLYSIEARVSVVTEDKLETLDSADYEFSWFEQPRFMKKRLFRPNEKQMFEIRYPSDIAISIDFVVAEPGELQ